MAAFVRNEQITTEISNREAQERYRLNTSHSFTLVSEGELSEETIGKVCAAIVEWTIAMGLMPLKNIKFNAQLGRTIELSLSSGTMSQLDYTLFMKTAEQLVAADKGLRSLMSQHTISRFELNGHNQFFYEHTPYAKL